MTPALVYLADVCTSITTMASIGFLICCVLLPTVFCTWPALRRYLGAIIAMLAICSVICLFVPSGKVIEQMHSASAPSAQSQANGGAK